MANRPKYLTPLCVTGWCSLQAPDTTFADKNKPDDLGVYKAMLRMPKDDPKTKKFIEELQGHWDEFVNEQRTQGPKGKKIVLHEEGMPWADEKDRETDEPTGFIIVRTKLKARVVLGSGKTFDQRPKIFDAQKKLMTEVPNVGPGSKVRVAGQVNCWHTNKAGMTLWLEAVQIVELVERGGMQSADDFGFDGEEGFTSETQETFPAGDGTGNF